MKKYTHEEKKVFLTKRGWAPWYHEDYWVNTKMVTDPSISDYTNHGLSLEKAFSFTVKHINKFPERHKKNPDD